MKRDEKVYILHMLDAITRIEVYLENVKEDKFQDETLTQDAVIRQLEIIGEAAKQVSSEIRDKYDEIPWKDISGMRDKLIHDYFGVDIDEVWLTTKNDLPALKSGLESILKDLR